MKTFKMYIMGFGYIYLIIKLLDGYKSYLRTRYFEEILKIGAAL